MNNTDYREKLWNFMDNKDIQAGQSIDKKYLILVYDNDTYELIEKLLELAIKLNNKKYKLNEFMEYFYKIDPDNLDYQENWIYCGNCGSYARHESYGVNDQYYIDNGEATCKNCFDIDDYIDYLINNHNNCNVLLNDDQICKANYVILTNYEFQNTMYTEDKQTNKDKIQEILKEYDYFYYLNTCHMLGAYYTIAVKRDNLKSVLKLLKNSELYYFHK